MNSINFFKTFSFYVFKYDNFHLTDMSKTPIPKHYFGCLTKGSAQIISKKEKISVKPFEIFYIPKGLKYQSKWYGDENGKIEFFSFGFEFSPIDKPFVLQKITPTPKAQTLFDDLCKEIPITEKGVGKLYYFFGEIAESMQRAKYSHLNSNIEKITECMFEHPEYNVSSIAKYCNVSESGIYSLFKRHLNKTPNAVRIEILCEKAVLLLTTTNKTVGEISDSLGFSSTSYFRKVLKKKKGQSPSQIRKQSFF